jgi:uncharacterized OB-fold protein
MATAQYTKPLPQLTKLNAPFWEGTKRGELRMQRCSACRRIWFPPSRHCPECLADTYEWVALSGRGRVWSWIVMHQRYFKAFEGDLPYVVALIELLEGPLFMSTIVGVPSGQIRCDMPVRAVFEDATEQMAVPKFTPA